MEKRFHNRVRHHLVLTLFLLTISLFCILAFAQLTFAQGEISHSYTYGQSITFDLTVDDTAVYDNYSLFISASGMNVTSNTINPTNNSVTYERDLRDQPLPPFSHITYWWEYSDNNKALITTEKKTFQYTDNRFEWQTYADNDIHIYWINGEKSTMMNASTIVRETMDEVQYALQTSITPTVDVFFYPSTLDLQSALQLAGFEWVAGAAYPELGVILLSATEGNQALSQMQKTLPHEMTHKMLFDAYGAEGYKNIPAWLEEGLASFFEPNPDPAYTIVLGEANTNGKLIGLDTLCYPFPDDQSVALLSYAQSESMTKYIQQTYGWSTIRSLLQLYADEGVACTSGLEQVLNVQTNQFERDWRVWLQTQGSPNPVDPTSKIFHLSPELEAAIKIFVKDASRWLVLCVVLYIPFFIFSIQTMLKRKSTR